jgi:serine/threonine protein kinase
MVATIPDNININIKPTMTNDNSEEESSSTSTKSKQPFSHLATKEVLQELEDFESALCGKYYDSSLDGIKATIPLVDWQGIVVESVLGEGGFSFVFQVNYNENKTYALKCLKAKAVTTTDDLTYNAQDLYTEAYLLARLNHPHIIQLHGISKYGLADSYLRSDGYFVLLDIMKETLEDKLNNWRNDPNRSKNWISKSAIVQRLQNIAIPVVQAMEYLHAHHIVLRDLKPENVGFDKQSGQVKLFDFGLARRIDMVEPGDVAGSICYMAPEVMLEQGTILQSDVYSFGLCCWELCTLEIPLARFDTKSQVQQRVAQGNWRPSCSSIPSKTLRQLIQSCWQSNPRERPSFDKLGRALQQVCTSKKDDAPSSLEGSVSPRLLSPMGRRSKSMGTIRTLFAKKDQDSQSQQNLSVHSLPHVPLAA